MSTNYKVILDPIHAPHLVKEMIDASNEIDFSNITPHAKAKFLAAQQKLEDMCLNGIHLGKQSAGWVFCFRAYPEHDFVSWQDWKKYIKDKGLLIRNEYNETISLEEFEVEIKKAFYYMGKLSGHHSITDEANWVDNEGFDFCNYEFD